MNQPVNQPVNESVASRNNRVIVPAALTLIIAAVAAGNLFWLHQNQLQYGHDASAHLARSLKVAAEWAQPSLLHLMRGLTVTDYRPPGLYMASQPFYWMFGRSVTTALYANVAGSALLMLATFLLARRTVGNWLAILAATVTALMPMMLAVTRTYYTEVLVTLFFTLQLYFLLKTEGFSRRGWALAWGAALGAGVLVKWTLPVYIVAPLAVVLWQHRHGLWPSRREALRFPGWRGAGVRVLAAAAIAGLLLALIYWPDRDYWLQSMLGPAVPMGWFVAWFCLALLLLWPATPLSNLFTGLALWAAIGLLWYLPEAGFIDRLSDVAFGSEDIVYNVDWASPAHYLRYFTLFYEQHTGLLIFLALVPAGLLPWLWRGRTWLRTLPDTPLIWLSALAPFVILMVTSQTNARNINPVLPLFAILICTGLLAYKARWRWVWAGVWIAALLSFWATTTVDAVSSLRDGTSLLWPDQTYSVPPASGLTDPRYWIVPDVLATISTSSTETTTLGVMLNMAQLHPGSFVYPILNGQHPVDVMTLTGDAPRGPYDVIANEWVLLKDGDNEELGKQPQRDLVNSILGGASWFHDLYSLAKRYSFPNGENAYLYHRVAGPPNLLGFSTIVREDLPPVADAIRRWWSPHATLVFATADEAVWLGTQDIPIEHAIIPPPNSKLEPIDLSDVKGTLIFISRYGTEGFQQWLNVGARHAEDVTGGEFTASLYSRSDRPLETVPAQAQWPGLRLRTLQSWPEVRAGEVLPVDITLDGQLDGKLKLSLRLADASGKVVAQQDLPAAPGPISFSLFAPTDAAPGSYHLQVVVYDAANPLAPLPDAAGQSSTTLTTIKLMEPS